MADYGQNAIQAGDVLMIHTNGAGDIIESNGIIRMTQFYETMVYLILFGGNDDDDGSDATKNNQWWGNEGEPVERQYRGRFHFLVASGRAVNSAFIKELQDAALEDLENGLDGYAQSVSVTVRLSAPKRIDISGKILFLTGDEYPFFYEVAA